MNLVIQQIHGLLLVVVSFFLWDSQPVDSIPCTGSSDLFYCFEYPGLPLDTDQACIVDSLVCNGDRDCPFGDDEWNCNTYGGLNVSCTDDNGFFECTNSPANEFLPTSDTTNICIRREYSCDVNEFETWDCPNQEDLAAAECPANFTQPCLDPDHFLHELFFECTVNSVCIYDWWVCDGKDDCLDGEDELNSTCVTRSPTSIPTNMPSVDPTSTPTNNPTTPEPTPEPTPDPSPQPTPNPTEEPTDPPSFNPTIEPTSEPTDTPTPQPTPFPTQDPSDGTTPQPTTRSPTTRPIDVGQQPTDYPTRPSCWWTNYRGRNPQCQPTPRPTPRPTDVDPTTTESDSSDESTTTSDPTPNPTPRPTDRPTTSTPTTAYPTRPSDWWTNYRGGGRS